MPGLSDLLNNRRRLSQLAQRPGGLDAIARASGYTTPTGQISARQAQDPITQATGLAPARRTSTGTSRKDPTSLDTGAYVDKVKLPDGRVVRPQTPSGVLAKVPGRANLFVDPATGDPYKPDPTAPTGLKSAWMDASKRAKGGRIVAVLPGIGERDLGPDPVTESKAKAKADKEAAKVAETEQKNAIKAEQDTRAYDLYSKGRAFRRDWQGNPVPKQTDEEWQAESSKKLMSGRLKNEIGRLDIDTTRAELDVPKADDLKASEKYLEAIAGLDAEQMKAVEADPEYQAHRQKLDTAKAARERVDKLKRKKLDLQEQLLDPDKWEAATATRLQQAPDEELDDEIKDNAEIANSIMSQANKRHGKLESEVSALQEQRDTLQNLKQAALIDGITAEEQAELDRKAGELDDALKAHYELRAPERAEIQGDVAFAQQRAKVADAAVAVRVARQKAATSDAVAQLRAKPHTAVFADELESLVNAAQAGNDIEKPVQDLYARVNAAEQEKAKAGADLWQNWGSGLHYDWANDKAIQPRLRQEAESRGMTVKEAINSLETHAALDWSKPLDYEVQAGNREPIFAESRDLPDGSITVNPKHWGDPETYRQAVETSTASPAAKDRALQQFPELQRLHAQEALKVLSTATDIPGADDFHNWRDRKIAESQAGQGKDGFTKLTPEDHAIAYMAAMKDRPWLRKLGDQITQNTIAGFADIGTQLVGASGILSGSEAVANLAAKMSGNTQALTQTNELTGTDSDLALRTVGQITRMAPGVVATLATAGATGGGLTVAAIMGGAQTAGSMFAELYGQNKEQGMEHGEAWLKSALPAAAGGAITAGLTKGFGATGIERVLATGEGKEALKRTFTTYLKQMAKGAGEELPEEIGDEYFSQMIQAAAGAQDPVAAMQQFIKTLPELGLSVAALGAGGGAVQTRIRGVKPGEEGPQTIESGETPIPANLQAQPNQTAAATPQNVQDAIKAFQPSDDITRPQAVNAQIEASKKKPAVVAQDAAAGMVAVAQGAKLDTLPAAQLEALGYKRGPKGIDARDKKVAPLVYEQDGQLVIRQEGIDWLEAEKEMGGSKLLRDQIGKSEAERLAEIKAPKKAKPAAKPAEPAKETLKPKQSPKSQGGQLDKSGGPLPPETGSIPVPATNQPAAKPKPTKAPKDTRPALGEAPPAQRKAIGKGMKGSPAYAEFATETDAEAFAYTANRRAVNSGRNLSDDQRKRHSEAAKGMIARVAKATGIDEKTLSPILNGYNLRIRELAKAIPEGQPFQAPTLAEFIASQQPQPTPANETQDTQGEPAVQDPTSRPDAKGARISPVVEDGQPQQQPAEVSPVGKESGQGSAAVLQQEAALPEGADDPNQQAAPERPAATAVSPVDAATNEAATPPASATPEEVHAALAPVYADVKARKFNKQASFNVIAATRAIKDAVAKLGSVVPITVTSEQVGYSGAAWNDGAVVINPAQLAAAVGNATPNAKAAAAQVRKVLKHEVIHQRALATVGEARLVALFDKLIPEAKQASKDAYFAAMKQQGVEAPPWDNFTAANEWWAQLIEARTEGILASESPSFAAELQAFLRDFVAALRDLAKLIKDPELRAEIEAEAATIQSAVEEALGKAGMNTPSAANIQEAPTNEPDNQTPVSESQGGGQNVPESRELPMVPEQPTAQAPESDVSSPEPIPAPTGPLATVHYARESDGQMIEMQKPANKDTLVYLRQTAHKLKAVLTCLDT